MSHELGLEPLGINVGLNRRDRVRRSASGDHPKHLGVIQAKVDRFAQSQRPRFLRVAYVMGNCPNFLGEHSRTPILLCRFTRRLRVVRHTPRSRTEAGREKHHRQERGPNHPKFADDHGLHHSFDEHSHRRRDRPGRHPFTQGSRCIADDFLRRCRVRTVDRNRGPNHSRRCQTQPDQPVAQPLAPSKPPALDRSHRTPHPPRRLLAGVSLKVAKHDRHTITLGKPVDLLVEHPLELGTSFNLVTVDCRRHFRGTSFVPAPSRSRRARARRRAKGHLVQPGTERIPHPESAGLLHQNQERGLESILRVVGVNKLRPADAQNHRAVTLDQGRESELRDLALTGGKRSSNCPSESSRVAPMLKSVLNCRRTAPSLVVRTARSSAVIDIQSTVSNVTAGEAGCNFLGKKPRMDVLERWSRGGVATFVPENATDVHPGD